MLINFKIFLTLATEIISILLLNVSCDKSWEYELQDISCISENKDIFDCHLEVVRISRGVYGISGYMDIKSDLDDSLLTETNLYRSPGMGPSYFKIPMDISNETLTNLMNKYYKPYLMEELGNCSTNAAFDGTFEPPLTKRMVLLDKCIIPTDKLPSHMADGNYRMVVNLHNFVEVTLDSHFKIEKVY